MELRPSQAELVLASQSPRRRELLRRAGIPFRVIQPDDQAECGICSRETPPELVSRLAFQKAASVARTSFDRIGPRMRYDRGMCGTDSRETP